MLGIDLRRVRIERSRRVQDRLALLVVDFDQGDGGACLRSRRGRHRGDHIADATGLLAHRDESRPVVVDQPVPAISRNVGGRGHGHDAGQLLRLRGVDMTHLGAGVGRQQNCAVQHSRQHHVVHVRLVAQGQLLAGVAGERAADPSVTARLRDLFAALGSRQELDRVEDLGVAGASTEVPCHARGDLIAGQLEILVEHALGAHGDAGDAEPALETGDADEALGDQVALLRVEALEGHDLLPVGLRSRHGTGRLGHAVDQGETAATLPLRLAPVLRRGDAALEPERVEQALTRLDRGPLWLAVEGE